MVRGAAVRQQFRATHRLASGTALVFCVTSNGADYSLTIDGNTVQTVLTDPACDGLGGGTALVSSDLNASSHHVILDVPTPSAAQQFEFYGGLLTTSVQTGCDDRFVILEFRWLTTPAVPRSCRTSPSTTRAQGGQDLMLLLSRPPSDSTTRLLLSVRTRRMQVCHILSKE